VNTGDNQAVGKAIVLVGLMGTGKSSVGAKVARSIDAQFIDTDDLIAQQSGRSVREIFAQDGEAAFRDAEVAALNKAFETVRLGNDTVISTGGGINLRCGQLSFSTDDLLLISNKNYHHMISPKSKTPISTVPSSFTSLKFVLH